MTPPLFIPEIRARYEPGQPETYSGFWVCSEKHLIKSFHTDDVKCDFYTAKNYANQKFGGHTINHSVGMLFRELGIEGIVA